MSKEKHPHARNEQKSAKKIEEATSLRKKIGEKATALHQNENTGTLASKAQRAIQQRRLVKAERAAQKHFKRNESAYQEEAQKMDIQRTVMKKTLDTILTASPEEVGLMAALQGYNSKDQQTLVQHTAERHSSEDTEASARERGLSALKKIPGTDPVLAVVDNRPQDIPESGWLITSHIVPGYGGKMDIYRYEEGQLTINPPTKDNREEYGEARVHFDIDGHSSHTLAYENPNFPNKDTEPFNRMSQSSYTGLSFGATDIVPLSNGGRLLDEAAPFDKGSRRGISTSMDWRDLDSKYASEFPINRIVSDQRDIEPILMALGDGMGLETQDIETLTATISQKINPSQA